MTDLRSWARRWNDASLRRVVTLRQPSRARRWPLVGMFAIGFFAGTIGTYAVTQRSQIKRFAMRTLNVRHEMPDESGGSEFAGPVSVTSHRSNHRRKAAVEVT